MHVDQGAKRRGGRVPKPKRVIIHLGAGQDPVCGKGGFYIICTRVVGLVTCKRCGFKIKARGLA